MARYIDADKYVEYLEKEICSKCIDDVCGACGLDNARWIAKEFPTADVVPKSETAKTVLLDLKRQIHEKAVYPHNCNIDPYIGIKVFDSVLNNVIKKYADDPKEAFIQKLVDNWKWGEEE